MNFLLHTVFLFTVLVGSRLAGLPDNFTPLLALAIFLPRINAWPWLPLAVLAVTDIVLGVYTVMPVVYACMVFAVYFSTRTSNMYTAGAFSVLCWHVLVNGAVVISGPGFAPFTPEALIFDLRLLASTVVFLWLFDVVHKFSQKRLHAW